MNKYKYSVGGAYKEANDYLYQIQSLIKEENILERNISENLILNNSYNELELDLESFINTGSNFEQKDMLIAYKSMFENYKTVDTYDFNTELLKNYNGRLSYKEGIDSKGLQQEILSGVDVFRKYGDVTITSGLRLVIKKGAGMKSLHLHGKAVDIRLNDFLRANLDKIKQELLDYDILDEGDHIHLEFQLKKKKAQYGYGDNLLLNILGSINQLELNSSYYLNLLLYDKSSISSKGILINNEILHSSNNSISNFNTGLKSNSFQNINFNQTNNESNIDLDNASYGALDTIALGVGQLAQAATQQITSGLRGAESFIRTGDGLGAVTDMFSNVLVVGGILKSVKGVRDSVRQKRQEAVANRLQEFGAIGSIQQMLGNQKEEAYERKQRIASFKRLVFTNFNNNGINNNLMYYQYGGKYKIKLNEK